MKTIKIFCESRIDYKYESIFSRLEGVAPVEGTFWNLLGQLFKSKKSIYHIRYLKYRGILLTPFRIILIFLICKITSSKIIWTCHNIYEHNIDSKKYNDWLRKLVGGLSHRIVVFHEDLIPFFPEKLRKKIRVACFGDFRPFIASQDEPNPEFQDQYSDWIRSRKVHRPDLISISAAKRNRLEYLIEGVSETPLNTLIIAPNYHLKTVLNGMNGIFFYNKFVKKEVADILKNPEGMIGFIGHENISVPTSIYMYASYGVPVIAINKQPVNTLIKEHKIGEIAEEPGLIVRCVQEIRDNYDFYKNNCKEFLTKNSWEVSADVHTKVFV